jgi:hypothetical protein
MGNLIQKLRRKLGGFVYKYIHWNSRYKPDGFYNHTEQYCQETPETTIVCREVYPSMVTHLKIPYLMYNALSDYSKYDETIYIDSDPALWARTSYKLVQVPNGRLYSNNLDMVAVITSDNKLLGDMSYQYLPDRPALTVENRILRQGFLLKPRHYQGTVCNLLAGGGAIDHYSHWLIDVLPRLHFLQKAGLLQQTDWFVVPNYTHGFQKDSLRLLGIDESKVIVATNQIHVQADRLLATTAPRGKRSKIVPQWVVDFLRSSFMPKIADESRPAFVYLKSEPGGVKVHNDAELQLLLNKYGFQSYVLSDLSFEEQVEVFSSAKIIVAASQIGLTNLAFCQPGAKILEIMDGQDMSTFYYNLANFAGADFHYLLCKAHRHVLNPNPKPGGGVVVETHKVRLLLDKFTGRHVRIADQEEQELALIAAMPIAS